MSASYVEITGNGIMKPSFIVEGWAVKVRLPSISSELKDGKWTDVYHPEREGTVGFVFDRGKDDMGGGVGDYFWYKSSHGYLWRTKDEAISAYWRFLENNRSWLERHGITHEKVYLGVFRIVHEQKITAYGE